MDQYFSLTHIGNGEAILRFALAALFGLVIGFERGEKGKPIDFRAYIIITMTTCALTLISLELAVKDAYEIDLGRIISGIVTGIGFLGAGAIMKIDDDKVVGTATGASIWSCGAVGLSLGFGFYGLAGLLFAALFITLFGGGFLARRLGFRK